MGVYLLHRRALLDVGRCVSHRLVHRGLFFCYVRELVLIAHLRPRGDWGDCWFLRRGIVTR